MKKSPITKKYPDTVHYYISYDGQLCATDSPRPAFLFRDKIASNGNEIHISGQYYKQTLVIDTTKYDYRYKDVVSTAGDITLEISAPNKPFQGKLSVINPFNSGSQKKIGQTIAMFNSLDKQTYFVNLRDFFTVLLPIMDKGQVDGTFLYDSWNGYMIIRRVGEI